MSRNETLSGTELTRTKYHAECSIAGFASAKAMYMDSPV